MPHHHNRTFNFGYSGGQIIPEFGLVIVIGVIAWIIQFVFSIQVGLSRRKFGIEPPRMTETSLIGSVGNINAPDVVLDEAAPMLHESHVPHLSANTSYASSSSSSASSSSGAATASASYGIHAAAIGEAPDEYRRYQRVHLNNVENAPFFFGLLIFAGIGYPFGAFVAGCVYQLGRVTGAIGYYHSTKERRWGSLFHVGEFVLVGLALATAIQMLNDFPAPVTPDGY